MTEDGSQRTAYQHRIDALLRDSEGDIGEAEHDQALTDAVREYSRHKPDVKVADVTGEGSRLIALPPGWEMRLSRIQSLAYPAGIIPPAFITKHEFYHSPDAIKIVLPFTIGTDERVRVRFTAPHVLDADTDTIPPVDSAAICQYAAAALLDQLAAMRAGDQDSTIASDSVDTQGKADVYRRQATSLRKRFYGHLGVDPNRNPPAGQVVNLNLPSSRGHDRLTHSNRYR